MSKSGTIIIVDDNKGVLTAVEILLKSYFSKVVTLSSPVTLITVMQEEIPEVKFIEEEDEDYEDFSQPVFIDGEEEEQPHVYHEEPLTEAKPNPLKLAVITGVMIAAITIGKKIKK